MTPTFRNEGKAFKYEGRPVKWDYNLAFMLYAGGMNLSQIIAQDAFKGLNYTHLCAKATKYNWSGKKGELDEKVMGTGARDLAERMSEAKIAHQAFMLDQIEEERQAILEDMKLPGSKNRNERLNALRTLDEIARKNLGLDEEKIMSYEEKIFGMLIRFQQQPPQPKLAGQTNGNRITIEDKVESLVTKSEEKPISQIPHEELSMIPQSENESENESAHEEPNCLTPATYPLLANKNATTGILSSRNAYPDSGESKEMQSETLSGASSNGENEQNMENSNESPIETEMLAQQILAQPKKMTLKEMPALII